MTRKLDQLDPNRFWSTYDLGLCSALFCLAHNLYQIEKAADTNRAQFTFHRNQSLDRHVEDYWGDRLKLNARSYFDSIRAVKNRLYSD